MTGTKFLGWLDLHGFSLKGDKLGETRRTHEEHTMNTRTQGTQIGFSRWPDPPTQ